MTTLNFFYFGLLRPKRNIFPKFKRLNKKEQQFLGICSAVINTFQRSEGTRFPLAIDQAWKAGFLNPAAHPTRGRSPVAGDEDRNTPNSGRISIANYPH